MKYEKFKHLSGIYKINFPNGKYYIGLSNNIARRLKEHNSSCNNISVGKAIAKYYNNDTPEEAIEILELIDENHREFMKEREQYWIAYFNANNKLCGYNLTKGGDGLLSGCDNNEAKLNQEQLEQLYYDLIYNVDIYIYELAEKYHLSAEAISDINNGNRYKQLNYTYPLRKPPKPKVGKGLNNHLSKFDNEDIDEIYNLLICTNISLQEIAKIKHVSYATISAINRGLRYQKENYNFPLRTKQNSALHKLTNDQAEQIRQLILTTDLTFVDIGKQMKISRDVVGRINSGKAYYSENYSYPLRRSK